MSTTLAILAVLAVAIPNALPLSRVWPGAAIAVWTAALTVRALMTVSIVVFLLVAFPDTEAFRAVAHWCKHAVVPLVGLHFDLHGHLVTAVLAGLPAAAVALSFGATLIRMTRTRQAVSALLGSDAVATGPERSVIVGDAEVLVAAAGVARPRIIVSAGALAMLDDDELAAGLAHEQAHIEHHHMLLLAYGELCRSVASVLLGTRRALGELRLQVERDADAWAVRRRHDPLALASAICKAAESREQHGAMARLHGCGIEQRLTDLLEPPSDSGSMRRRVLDTAVVLAACTAVIAGMAVPADSLAGDRPHAIAHDEHHCQD